MGEIQKAQQEERDRILGALWALRLAVNQTLDGWVILNAKAFDAACSDADKLISHIRAEPVPTKLQGTRELPLTISKGIPAWKPFIS